MMHFQCRFFLLYYVHLLQIFWFYFLRSPVIVPSLLCHCPSVHWCSWLDDCISKQVSSICTTSYACHHWRPNLPDGCCICLEQSAGASTGIAVTASFSQQTEDRAFCPVVQQLWLRASHCTDYHVTSLLFLRVTCPCSLRTYATLKFIRSSSSSSSSSSSYVKTGLNHSRIQGHPACNSQEFTFWNRCSLGQCSIDGPREQKSTVCDFFFPVVISRLLLFLTDGYLCDDVRADVESYPWSSFHA